MGPCTLAKVRESFKSQKLLRELALQYPRVTQGGNSHHCGKAGEERVSFLLAHLPQRPAVGGSRHLLLVAYLILWLQGWGQSEGSRRQFGELPQHLAQPFSSLKTESQ